MENWIPSISLQTVREEHYRTNVKVIHVESRALAVRFPFGGFIWNTPTAVQIEEGGFQTRQPIVDPTRITMLSFSVISLIIFISSMILAARLRGFATKE